jgi:hypothetical protein
MIIVSLLQFLRIILFTEIFWLDIKINIRKYTNHSVVIDIKKYGIKKQGGKHNVKDSEDPSITAETSIRKYIADVSLFKASASYRVLILIKMSSEA